MAMKKTGWFLWSLVGLVWLVVSLPFTDYSLTALFEIPESPPRSHDGLKALLEHIVYASNVSMLSGVLLYGLNRGWYLGGDYPAFLRRFDLQARFTNAFQNPFVFAATNVVLALLFVISSVLLFQHGRILGRGLGYW